MTNRLSEAEREKAEREFHYWMAQRRDLEQHMMEIERRIDRLRRTLDNDFRARAAALQSNKG